MLPYPESVEVVISYGLIYVIGTDQLSLLASKWALQTISY